MKEEKITISVNQEDVQNIINCYEKDIEKIKQLQEETEVLKEKVKGMQEERDYLFNKLSIENKSLQSQLKAKEEAVEKFEKYLNNCVNELENNYGLSSIQNSINTGIIDITKVILSKFNEILSKGENK